MEDFYEICIGLQRRNTKSKQLTDSGCNGALQRLLQLGKDQKLEHGAIIKVTAEFEVNRLTISRIWKAAEEQYEYEDLQSELRINPLYGEIHSNGILSQEWRFCPKEEGDYEFEIQCVVNVLKNGISIGPKSYVALSVLGSCEKGFLAAIPYVLNFGNLEFNNSKTLNFNLVNCGAVEIPFKLICHHRNWMVGNAEKDVIIRPVLGTIHPEARENVDVTITPCTPGFYELVIQYYIRINPETDTPLSNEMPRNLCEINCMCVLPTLKVVNLCTYGSCPNMSKLFLWRTMQIDTLNKVLKNIIPGKMETLRIHFDPVMLNTGATVIKLIITNPTKITANWSLKYIPCCSCKSISRKDELSSDCSGINCIHKDVCLIKPKSGSLKSRKETVVTIKLRYTVLGESKIKWDLQLDHDRHIVLNMEMECLSESEEKLYFLSGTHLKFGSVYFGYLDAVYQAHWIENPTNYNLEYKVDIGPLRELNRRFHCDIFSCMSQYGVVNARSCKPIIIRFQPRLFGFYKVALPVMLGNRETELIVEGESTFEMKSDVECLSVSDNCTCKIGKLPVYFSKDFIVASPTVIHHRTIRMLLIYNDLMDDSVAYQWKSVEVPEIVHIEVYPHRGIIQPKTVQSFRIEIDTKGTACKIDVNLPCEFVNAGERRLYRRSVLKHAILTEELKGQFIITEKGDDVPKPWIKILEKPKSFFKTLTVCCHIHGPEDERLSITLTKKLKNIPTVVLHFDASKTKAIPTDKKGLDTCLFILEGFLWEVLKSRTLETIVKETLVNPTNLNYTNFVMNLADRKNAVKRSYISPPLKHVDSILEKMLFTIVHQEFSLDITHLVSGEDIRYVNYPKMLTIENKITTEIDGGHKRSDKYATNIDVAPSGSPVIVSFVE